MRYAREVGVKKNLGERPTRSRGKAPYSRVKNHPKNDPKNNPEKGVLFCLWGESAFYLVWERV